MIAPLRKYSKDFLVKNIMRVFQKISNVMFRVILLLVFQAAVVSILLYGCTTWTLTKRLEKKLDGNYTRMLRAILNKSWGQHPTRHKLYGHLPLIPKTIQVRRTRHGGHCWRSDILRWTTVKAWQKQVNQLEHTFSSYVRIRDVALKTCRRRWTIGKSGKRGSGISVLAARHDDDDDDFTGPKTFKPRKVPALVLVVVSALTYCELPHFQSDVNTTHVQ